MNITEEPCLQTCPRGHLCLLECFEECQVEVEQKLKCGHNVMLPCSTDTDLYLCQMLIEVPLPECNHVIKKPCHVPIEENKCIHDCKLRLNCGHACPEKCHVNSDPYHLEYKCKKICGKTNTGCVDNHPCMKQCYEDCEPCLVIVDKKRSCGHIAHVRCSDDLKKHLCEEPCNRLLDCGHSCVLKCSDDCGNCSVIVEKECICHHKVNVKCSEEATPEHCEFECQKKLPCGHLCAELCRNPCTKKCGTMVKLSKPGLCGHVHSVPCHLQNTAERLWELLKYCKEPCNFNLACGHVCKGKCNECYYGRYHVPCKNQCHNTFICGHSCEIFCDKECRPCSKPCELKCYHSRCNKTCGEPCIPCIEKCDYGCEHKRCTKRCYELCDIEPCEEPCKILLPCNHPCIGFCGDPCPPLCKVCDKDNLTEIFFGHEDDSNARFTVLPDCGHTLENSGLFQWIKDFNLTNEIQIIGCPKCKTPIYTCMRIINYIKKNFTFYDQIKKKIYFNDENEKILKIRLDKCVAIITSIENNPIVNEFSSLTEALSNLKKRSCVKFSNRRPFNYYEVNAFVIIFGIFVEIISILQLTGKFTILLKNWPCIQLRIDRLLRFLPPELQISDQRRQDIKLELKRLRLLIELFNVYSGDKKLFLEDYNKERLIRLNNTLCSSHRFSEAVETETLKVIKVESVYETRAKIVKAIGLKKGHWFKCPNGHFYVIDNCGGAMDRRKCIECEATIGGARHRLQDDNILASEIDGATTPAYKRRDKSQSKGHFVK